MPPPPALAAAATMMEIALGRLWVMRANFILVTSGVALEVALWGLLKRVALRTARVVRGTTRMVAGVVQVGCVAVIHTCTAVGLLAGTADAAMPATTVTVLAGVPSTRVGGCSGMDRGWMTLGRIARDLEVVQTAFGAKAVVAGLNVILRVMIAIRMGGVWRDRMRRR